MAQLFSCNQNPAKTYIKNKHTVNKVNEVTNKDQRGFYVHEVCHNMNYFGNNTGLFKYVSVCLSIK